MAADSKAKILREGERYVQQGKITQAISEYLKIVKIDPEDVLTLNIIGDLYLRQGRVGDANRLFLQVAESYARNNFLLKAIAVYRKILHTDPHNIQVNQQVASLYARQGMTVDARSQYLYVADLHAREGDTNASLEAYEKVVEIDPMNAAILLKLAETYRVQGLQDKAHICYAGAARAQMKAGEIGAAMTAFRHALAIDLSSSEALKGFLESALQTDDLRSALSQVKESITSAQDDPELQELLGRAYLAAGDIARAEQYFQAAYRGDDARYECFLLLSATFLQADDPDRALACLNQILSTLVCRRETEKLVEGYESILARYPSHLATLGKLSEILAAVNDEARNVAVLEKIADHHLRAGDAQAALETLDRILAVLPEDQNYLSRHREVFAQAFPGRPYRLPRAVAEAQERSTPREREVLDASDGISASGDEGSSSTVVEIDLLLNYGMKDKALQLLQSLETSTPLDKDVRRRLSTLYRDSGDLRLAAEQHLLLSAIYRKAGDRELAEKSWAEAHKLAPDWVDQNMDVAAFARTRGIIVDSSRPEGSIREPAAGQEVDLSGDLSEIFFKNAPAADEGAVDEAAAGALELPSGMRRAGSPESLEEQLQEVDFYIRLGFQEEARAKLDEIATAHPGHAEVARRYARLEAGTDASPDDVVIALSGGTVQGEPAPLAGAEAPVEPPLRRDERIADELELAIDRYGANQWFEMQEPGNGFVPETDAAVPISAGDPGAGAGMPENAMFADLMLEVNALTDQGIAREDYETHFSLGIAFREMGLTDDAIKEFQLAVKALDPDLYPREVIQSCGMLSTCYLEKGMPKSAIRWCQTGLGVREISHHEEIALRYDMAEAHSSAGESDRALECFAAIFGIDPSYRDVAQRIDAIKSGFERHAP